MKIEPNIKKRKMKYGIDSCGTLAIRKEEAKSRFCGKVELFLSREPHPMNLIKKWKAYVRAENQAAIEAVRTVNTKFRHRITEEIMQLFEGKVKYETLI